MIGEATLVPPITAQPFSPSGVSVESYTATPVYGSASAATSDTERSLPQPTDSQSAALCCQAGAVKWVLQPPPSAPAPWKVPSLTPPSFQTLSLSQVLVAL